MKDYNKITLEEKARCWEWGVQRYEENKTRFNIPDYDTKRFNLDPVYGHTMGVLAEWFVYKQVATQLGWSLEDIDPLHWVPFAEGKDYKDSTKGVKTPDIGRVLEVRRTNFLNAPLAVRTKDVAANALVAQVYIPYTQEVWGGPIKVQHEDAIIVGWRDANEVWNSLGATIPSYSRKGDTKTTFIRNDWDEFDWGVFQ